MNPSTSPSLEKRATTVTITQSLHVFNVDRNIEGTYHTIDNALKTHHLEAVQNIYIEDLYNEYIGYSGITTRQILAHLWATYGDIDDGMIGSNTERVKIPWSPPTAIETLFTQLKVCQRLYAEVNDPITDSQSIRTGLQIV